MSTVSQHGQQVDRGTHSAHLSGYPHAHPLLAVVGTLALLQELDPERFSDDSGWSDIFSDRKFYETDRVERTDQIASHNRQRFPIGWLQFPKPGRYQVSASCLEGNTQTASLKAIRFTPIP